MPIFATRISLTLTAPKEPALKVQPTPEQWAILTPTERTNFKISDFFNRDPEAKFVLSQLSATVGRGYVELATSNLCPDHHFDKFTKIDPSRGVMLVANHRSFFDLFAIVARLFTLYGNHHAIFFPVRSTFFYDHPLGQCVNIPLAMGSMYPPIMRDPNRKIWNRFSTDLLVELLKNPRNMVGFHPEGTRSQTKDPYELLPAKPGAGELIYRARPNVVPVFLQGFPRYAWPGFLHNRGLLKKDVLWAHMVMGDPINLEEELSLPDSKETYLTISQKVMKVIGELAEEEKVIRRSWDEQRRRG